MLRTSHVALLVLSGFLGLSAGISHQDPASAKQSTGSVEGRVTVAGWLVPRNEYTEGTETDSNGRYRFEQVPPGPYWVEAISPRYVKSHQDSLTAMQGVFVSVRGGSHIRAADLDLLLAAVISGRAVDADGDGVARQRVDLIQIPEPGSGPVGMYSTWGVTDGSGMFTFEGIPAGHYLVSVGEDIARLTGAVRSKYDWSRTGRVAGSHYYEQTFWPGTLDRARAEPVNVPAGADVQDVNIAVGASLPAFAVSGRVVDAETGKPVARCDIGVGHRTGSGYDYSGGNFPDPGPLSTDENGDFRAAGLIPGRFFLGAHFPENSELFARKVEFEIQDKDISGIEIRALRGLTLGGMVAVEGNHPAAMSKLAQLKVAANSKPETVQPDGRRIEVIAPNPTAYRNGSVGADGIFKITGLQRGEFEVSISGDAERCFSLVRLEYPKLTGETTGPVTIAGPNSRPVPLTLEARDITGVRIVLAYKNSRIRGHVDFKGGVLPQGKRLYAGIGRADGSWSGLGAEVDADGNFLIEWLEPGDYRVLIETYQVATVTLSDVKTIHLDKDSEARVSFVVDLGGKK